MIKKIYKTFLKKHNLFSYTLYGLIFILILIKPKIVMVSIKDDKTFFTEDKLSYVKVFCIVMFVIILEVIIYFINNVKKKE